MYVNIFACKDVCAPCTYMHSNHIDQKKALDSLELELEAVVSHCVGAGN